MLQYRAHIEWSDRVKTKIYVSIAVVAAIVLISGATFLATAAPADQSDPLVTRSYLTNFFKPKVVDPDIKAAGDALTISFNKKVSEIEDEIGSIPSPPPASLFNTVTLKENETLSFSAGSEIMLRTNTGTAQMTSGELINFASGSALLMNASLVKNYMYLATENGVITATGAATIFIRGELSGTKGASTEININNEPVGLDNCPDPDNCPGPDECAGSDHSPDAGVPEDSPDTVG